MAESLPHQGHMSVDYLTVGSALSVKGGRWVLSEGYGNGGAGLRIHDTWGTKPELHLHDLAINLRTLGADLSLCSSNLHGLTAKIAALEARLSELEPQPTSLPPDGLRALRG